MHEGFVTALDINFVVIDPIGKTPIAPAVPKAQDRARKPRNNRLRLSPSQSCCSFPMRGLDF
jgi:hypothetical protein